MWGKPKEWLPWYRAHDYDGDLTEHEKRQLDGFRMQPKHPAADLDNLPEEVRTYIGQIEMGLYNQKQERVVSRAFGLSGVGAALLYVTYKGFGTPSIWSYAVGALLLVVPWFFYRHEWKKTPRSSSLQRGSPGLPMKAFENNGR